MASNSPLLLLPLPFLLSAALYFPAASGRGFCINYGRIADNLPPPEQVAGLVKSIHAARIRLYDADPRVLRAFAGTGVEVTVGLGNEHLASMRDPSAALAWVRSNVSCYLPATKITSINVGNEVLTANGTAAPAASPDDLLAAVENIHTALTTLGLDRRVSVTTAHNLGILDASYPPSSGKFRDDLEPVLRRLLDFHCTSGSPFMINAYPYFAYRDNPGHVSLKFALFEGDGIVDPITDLKYENMFEAQIDAAHAAMEKLGYRNVCLQVSETGWPSRGDGGEAGATPENAKAYNKNLLRRINQNGGTPMRPDMDLNVYFFALFNENQKPGPASEKNFGLFNPDMTPVYDLGFNSKGSGGTTPSGSPVVVMSPPDGGYMVDGAEGHRLTREGALLSVSCLVVSLIFLRYNSGFF
ncbi:glucan endo-1 3-beta-glucosidas [Striga asiatica]|uniref:glucan endo-1,3-beta-D-glucosidase n=1 Tax=Striga asiatica TaxID=4170 RepID=A0A5A7QF77_STRAF|nr:glucan endo-1 3-beta-glucosidas [Striga asiatica]